MSSLCPRPIGIRESIAFIPVFKGVSTGSLSITPAAILSRGISFPFFTAALPSRGRPTGLITRPSNSSDAVIVRSLPEVLTVSPSLICSPLPSKTILTESSSKFKISPDVPSWNITCSPIFALERPEATTTLSPICSIVPIFCSFGEPSNVCSLFSNFFKMSVLSICIISLLLLVQMFLNYFLDSCHRPYHYL